MADGDIRKANIGPNDAVLADFRLSFEEGKGIQDRITTHLDPFFHKGRGRIHDGDAFIHETAHNALIHDALGLSQLAAGIDAHDHVKVLGLDAAHIAAPFQAFGQDIGQIIFPLGIVIGQVFQKGKKQRHFHAVNPRIDFVNLPLGLTGILFFHDARNAAYTVTQNAAIAEGIGGVCRKDTDAGTAFKVRLIRGVSPQRMRAVPFSPPKRSRAWRTA